VIGDKVRSDEQKVKSGRAVEASAYAMLCGDRLAVVGGERK
jgi:hypothetical protein